MPAAQAASPAGWKQAWVTPVTRRNTSRNAPLNSPDNALTENAESVLKPAAKAGVVDPSLSLSLTLAPKRRTELDAIFAAEGLLARHIDGYRSRASQVEMARAVAAAMEASGRAMPEPAMFDAQRRPARIRWPEFARGTASTGIDGGENTLIVEAGTGTGKTFAYLVP